MRNADAVAVSALEPDMQYTGPTFAGVSVCTYSLETAHEARSDFVQGWHANGSRSQTRSLLYLACTARQPQLPDMAPIHHPEIVVDTVAM